MEKDNKPKKQTMRYSDEELGLIKATFAENDDLIKVLRKAFLQLGLSKAELTLLQTVFPENSSAFNLLKKTLHPEIDGYAPIFQVTDLWANVEIKDKSSDQAIPYIFAREIMVNYMTESFENLTKENPEYKIFLNQLTKIDHEEDIIDIHSKVLARNTILMHVEFQLNQLLTLAGKKEETVEKSKEKLAKNSSK